jgi:hypothetical protein
MTKMKAKASARPIRAKAASAKTAVTKRSAAPANNGAAALIVLGFDDEQKPRGARFDYDKPDLVTKAAELMGFKAFQASLPDVAEVAKKLPLGRLYANGRGFVPNIRQSLYTDVVPELAFVRIVGVTKVVEHRDGLDGVITAMPSAKFCRSWSLSSRLALCCRPCFCLIGEHDWHRWRILVGQNRADPRHCRPRPAGRRADLAEEY